jgi:hypothetical protein
MIGVANFNGKYKGIPLSAKQVDDTLIEIIVDNKKVSFKKGKKNLVKKELQSILNKILTKQYKELDDKYLELDAKKDNIKINKFVESLDLEFKNVKSMPVKKAVAKKKSAPKKAPAKKKAVAKKKVVKQTGTSVKKYDKMRQALPPGIRISKVTGKPYKEVRANRSDKGVLLGIGSLGLSDVINELTKLEIQLIRLKEDKKKVKLKSEKYNIQYDINILNKQFKTLKLYLNSIAKFTNKVR